MKNSKSYYKRVTREKLGIQKEYKNAELNIDAIVYLIDIGRKSEKYCFGSICVNNHEFQDSGYSIRAISNRNCMLCQDENYKKHLAKRQLKLKSDS